MLPINRNDATDSKTDGFGRRNRTFWYDRLKLFRFLRFGRNCDRNRYKSFPSQNRNEVGADMVFSYLSQLTNMLCRALSPRLNQSTDRTKKTSETTLMATDDVPTMGSHPSKTWENQKPFRFLNRSQSVSIAKSDINHFGFGCKNRNDLRPK